MNWLKRLFGRKSRRKTQGTIFFVQPPKSGLDIIGRQAGQKRNRVHIYRQPFGYPIRLCDWILVDLNQIEEVGRCQGLGGPSEMAILADALYYRETHGDRICRHCKAVASGNRRSVGVR